MAIKSYSWRWKIAETSSSARSTCRSRSATGTTTGTWRALRGRRRRSPRSGCSFVMTSNATSTPPRRATCCANPGARAAPPRIEQWNARSRSIGRSKPSRRRPRRGARLGCLALRAPLSVRGRREPQPSRNIAVERVAERVGEVQRDEPRPPQRLLQPFAVARGGREALDGFLQLAAEREMAQERALAIGGRLQGARCLLVHSDLLKARG